ncbi:MAG: hypothetical protein ACQEQ7_07835 [Thermodesulfobacteriota bacterium]
MCNDPPGFVVNAMLYPYITQAFDLLVSGTDAVNGSPVIDIKPYVKEWYPQTGTTIPPWMQQILDEAGEGKES